MIKKFFEYYKEYEEVKILDFLSKKKTNKNNILSKINSFFNEVFPNINVNFIHGYEKNINFEIKDIKYYIYSNNEDFYIEVMFDNGTIHVPPYMFQTSFMRYRGYYRNADTLSDKHIYFHCIGLEGLKEFLIDYILPIYSKINNIDLKDDKISKLKKTLELRKKQLDILDKNDPTYNILLNEYEACKRSIKRASKKTNNNNNNNLSSLIDNYFDRIKKDIISTKVDIDYQIIDKDTYNKVITDSISSLKKIKSFIEEYVIQNIYIKNNIMYINNINNQEVSIKIKSLDDYLYIEYDYNNNITYYISDGISGLKQILNSKIKSITFIK